MKQIITNTTVSILNTWKARLHRLHPAIIGTPAQDPCSPFILMCACLSILGRHETQAQRLEHVCDIGAPHISQNMMKHATLEKSKKREASHQSTISSLSQ
jgi:hypothetical protein